jgi:hypothetical protein
MRRTARALLVLDVLLIVRVADLRVVERREWLCDFGDCTPRRSHKGRGALEGLSRRPAVLHRSRRARGWLGSRRIVARLAAFHGGRSCEGVREREWKRGAVAARHPTRDETRLTVP